MSISTTKFPLSAPFIAPSCNTFEQVTFATSWQLRFPTWRTYKPLASVQPAFRRKPSICGLLAVPAISTVKIRFGCHLQTEDSYTFATAGHKLPFDFAEAKFKT